MAYVCALQRFAVPPRKAFWLACVDALFIAVMTGGGGLDGEHKAIVKAGRPDFGSFFRSRRYAK
ncbi:protein of unknown function [Burkholderia multivorans]